MSKQTGYGGQNINIVNAMASLQTASSSLATFKGRIERLLASITPNFTDLDTEAEITNHRDYLIAAYRALDATAQLETAEAAFSNLETVIAQELANARNAAQATISSEKQTRAEEIQALLDRVRGYIATFNAWEAEITSEGYVLSRSDTSLKARLNSDLTALEGQVESLQTLVNQLSNNFTSYRAVGNALTDLNTINLINEELARRLNVSNDMI